MHSSGLLVLSTHVSTLCKGDAISRILKNVKKLVKSNLYVHLNNAHGVSEDTQPTSKICLKEILSSGLLSRKNAGYSFNADVLPFVTRLYSEASLQCDHIDVSVLLHNIGTGANMEPHPMPNPVQCVMVDHVKPESALMMDFISSNFTFPNVNAQSGLALPVYGVLESTQKSQPSGGGTMMDKNDATVIGGTFDHIHYGHKVLLSETILLAKRKIVIGISEGPLLAKKTLKELIQPVEARKKCLEDFIRCVSRPGLELHLETIYDPYGPSITVPDIDVILVSKETEKGGSMVNDKRKERGLSQLKVHVIGQGMLLDDTESDVGDLPFDENKASSSSMRFRLLGTLLKPGKKPSLDFIPKSLPRPYIIGLTGGIAAGKSSVAKRLQNLGAIIIDCDKLGHQSYLPGSKAFQSIIEHFGQDIVSEDGAIDRRKLGGKVFSDKTQMTKLNSIVWPEIQRLCEDEIIRNLKENSSQKVPVFVLDAAVLLEAKWDLLTHEIWVVNVPMQEAVNRVVQRNRMSEEDARKRVESQPSNEWRTEKANVLLSTLWDPSVTQKMVEKSWGLLQERLHETDCPSNVTNNHKL